MIGFLAYLPTVAYIPHLLFVLVFICLILKKGPYINIGNLKNFGILLLIITLSIGNNLLHLENVKEFTDYIPFLILILISYIAALNFTKFDAKVLVFCIAVEAIVCMAESYYGVNTFFSSLEKYTVFKGDSLLYFNRTLGLSENSSATALKFLIGLILISYYKLKGKLMSISLALICIGIILTFNRTVIVTIIFFYGLYFIQNLFTAKAATYKILGTTVVFTFVSLVLIFFADEIYTKALGQFTRNTGSIELTGRTQVWYLFAEYIQQNFFLGNGSYKYMLDTYIRGRVFHAHNSYLQVLATHGIWISLLYFVLIAINITSKNVIFVLTIMLYSISQYGIFWGVSLLDIIFFLFLFSTKTDEALKTQTNFQKL